MIFHVTAPYGDNLDLSLDPSTVDRAPSEASVLLELTDRAVTGDVQMGTGALDRIIRSAAILLEGGHDASAALDTAMIWEWG